MQRCLQAEFGVQDRQELKDPTQDTGKEGWGCSFTSCLLHSIQTNLSVTYGAPPATPSAQEQGGFLPEEHHCCPNAVLLPVLSFQTREQSHRSKGRTEGEREHIFHMDFTDCIHLQTESI